MFNSSRPVSTVFRISMYLFFPFSPFPFKESCARYKVDNPLSPATSCIDYAERL